MLPLAPFGGFLDAIYRYNAGNYTRLRYHLRFRKPYIDSAIAATEDGSGALWLPAR